MIDRAVSSDGLKDFFISYAHADWQWARWIAQQLEEAGYSTVLPDRDFLAGSNLVLEMESATKQAERTIAVLSADYLASKFTPSEWTAAFRRDPKGEQGLLLLVRVQACDVPGLLGQLIYIDLVNKDEQKAQEDSRAGVQRIPRTLKQALFPSSVAYERSSFPAAQSSDSAVHVEPTRFGAPFPEVWNVPRRKRISCGSTYKIAGYMGKIRIYLTQCCNALPSLLPLFLVVMSAEDEHILSQRLLWRGVRLQAIVP